VSFNDLLKAALRWRPDRIILGEVRGEEARTLLDSFNTGHAGSMATIHASSAVKALRRFGELAIAFASAIESRRHLGRDSRGQFRSSSRWDDSPEAGRSARLSRCADTIAPQSYSCMTPSSILQESATMSATTQ